MLDCYWLVVKYYLRCSIISFTTHHCYTATLHKCSCYGDTILPTPIFSL